jgi:hypothetical protein
VSGSRERGQRWSSAPGPARRHVAHRARTEPSTVTEERFPAGRPAGQPWCLTSPQGQDVLLGAVHDTGAWRRRPGRRRAMRLRPAVESSAEGRKAASSITTRASSSRPSQTWTSCRGSDGPARARAEAGAPRLGSWAGWMRLSATGRRAGRVAPVDLSTRRCPGAARRRGRGKGEKARCGPVTGEPVPQLRGPRRLRWARW